MIGNWYALTGFLPVRAVEMRVVSRPYGLLVPSFRKDQSSRNIYLNLQAVTVQYLSVQYYTEQ